VRYIFGPVASRRLGRSLGVDLVPYKTCSFDCLYCELGTTTHLTLERKMYSAPQEIIDELKGYLKKLALQPDYITLGGSGEPTLHDHLGAIIAEIKKLTSIPVAVLTNSSLLYRDEVKEALLRADVILPSLDTVSPSLFTSLNRPHPALDVKKIIQGLIDFRKLFTGQIWLEILFCRGVNDAEEEIMRLHEVIREINPDKIQLNTLDRPPAEDSVFPVGREELERIKRFFGEKAEIITGSLPEDAQGDIADRKKRVYNLVKRRPCTFDEISLTLGIPKMALMDLIEALKNEGKVSQRLHNNQVYYQRR
jgi:wyosine [tRNA(Phe)-imidazoG37] synthetase (radical SAM superfamily)